MDPNRPSDLPLLVTMVVLVTLGLGAGLVLILNGHTVNEVAIFEGPLVIAALAAVLVRFKSSLTGQLQTIEAKVNGQMDATRSHAYSSGYAHGAAGLPPHHPINVADLEAAAHDRATPPKGDRRATPRP